MHRSNAPRPAPAETGNRPQNDRLGGAIVSTHKPVTAATQTGSGSRAPRIEREIVDIDRHLAIGIKACSHCGSKFKPLRRSARFCRPSCRVAAHRKSDCNANKPARTPPDHAQASQKGSEVLSGRSEPKNGSAATKRLSVTGQYDAFTIIRDAQWSGMHRIRRPDASLTGMINLTRAKEALLRVRAS